MFELNVPSLNMDLSTDGVWFNFTPDISFKIARDGNPAHERALQAGIKRFRKMEEKGEIRQLKQVRNELLTKYILKDWKGLTDGDEPLPYTQEAALAIISDPQYESIKLFILECSMDDSVFENDLEDTVKN